MIGHQTVPESPAYLLPSVIEYVQSEMYSHPHNTCIMVRLNLLGVCQVPAQRFEAC